MCWNFEVSIFTWIVGLITGLYLLYRRKPNDLIMGMLILTYSSMQLWEGLMWKDQSCGSLNLTATKLAYVALWSHVIAIAIALYIEQKAVIPLILGVGCLVAAYILRPDKWGCSGPRNGSRHIVWGFDPAFYMYVFAIAIALCLYYIRPVSTAAIVSALFLTSFIVSYMYGSKTRTTGSFWCWVCAMFCSVFIIVN
jgi:hypothetical protein